MPTDRKRARVNQEKPVPGPNSEPKRDLPIKKRLRMPPNVIDVTAQEVGRSYGFSAAPPPWSRSRRTND